MSYRINNNSWFLKDSLTRELEMNKNYSTALIKLWKKILLEYEDSALKNQLMVIVLIVQAFT